MRLEKMSLKNKNKNKNKNNLDESPKLRLKSQTCNP